MGNGFPPTPTEHLLMVAGGIGQTPFLALAREVPRPAGLRRSAATGAAGSRRSRSATACGASEYLAGVEDFRGLGVEVRVSTDDGSAGHRGLVTELIEPVVGAVGRGRAGSSVAVRSAMMEATAKIAKRLGVPCQVSLGDADGLRHRDLLQLRGEGPRRAPGDWDYRRTCVEGPVFDAEEIEF